MSAMETSRYAHIKSMSHNATGHVYHSFMRRPTRETINRFSRATQTQGEMQGKKPPRES